MGVNYFVFDGKSTKDFNVTEIEIEHRPNYPVAERVVEFIHVDGRNGDYVRDTGAYQNVTMTYSIFFRNWSIGVESAVRDVATWLNGSNGYCRLEDSYDPLVYRMAVMHKYTEYKNFRGKVYQVDVEFSCKPQRYIKGGDQPITFTNRIDNPYMPCYPLLVVVGNGDITIGGNTISVRNNAGKTMYIDTETQDAYSGVESSGGSQAWTGPYVLGNGDTKTFKVTKFNPNRFLEIFLTYTVKIANYRMDSMSHVIDPSTDFSYTYSVGGALVDGAYSIVKTAENNSIVFEGLRNYEVTLSSVKVSAVSNRNGDIVVSGQFPVVPTKKKKISYSTTSLQVIPRWWTL